MKYYIFSALLLFISLNATARNKNYQAKVTYTDGREETFTTDLDWDENGNIFLWKHDCERVYPGDTKEVEITLTNGKIRRGIPYGKEWLFVFSDGTAKLYSNLPVYKKVKDLKYSIGDNQVVPFDRKEIKSSFKSVPKAINAMNGYEIVRSTGYLFMGAGVVGGVVLTSLGYIYAGVPVVLFSASIPQLVRKPAIRRVEKAFNEYNKAN